MQNPEISGIEYQQGTLQGYEIREYLLEKWGRKCAYCKRENLPLQVEHIISRARGGTNRVSNLCMACEGCNHDKGTMSATEFGHPEVQAQAQKSLKDVAFMNIVRWKLANSIPGCHTTYGYITKHNRIKLGLEKSHVNDAFVIANGTNQSRCKPFSVKQIRRNNRSLQLNRKGFRPSIRTQRYKYSPGDLVLFTDPKDASAKKQKLLVKGVFNYGEWIKLENPIPGEKYISTNIKNVKLIKYGKGFRFSYSNIDLSSSHNVKTKETEKIKEIDEESIDTTSQTGLFGDEVIVQPKKVEKKEKKKKEKKVKTQYDLFGKKVKQDKSKKVTKKIESIESIDTTAQVGIN